MERQYITAQDLPIPLIEVALWPVGVVAPLVFSGTESGSSGLRVEVDEERPKPLVRGAR